METLSFQAPPEMAFKLKHFSNEFDRSKAYLIREAVAQYLEDLEDYEQALKSEAQSDPALTISLAELKKRHGLD